ncbi:MAG: insulinase family protein [Planctomycetaceae bacterium]|nr:insulinase family protein [Planctomycetaceae bacterium]
MIFRHHTLANGLEIIAECNPAAYSAAFAFFVQTGARDETDAPSGVSHFLEHMAFKGTPSRSAADVNRELDEMGAHSNAFTSEEQTVFYITVLPEYQSRAMDLLCDILRPSLRPDDFETEKQVILEEIAKYDDQPPFGAHEKSMALHFGTHPLAQSVLGTLDSVSALTPDQMRGYFAGRYVPNNMTLAAAGNVDFAELVALADQRCGAWQPAPVQRATPRAAANRAARVFPNDIATQQYVVQIANGPAAEDDSRFAARVLSTVVGGDGGSRFFWTLVDTGRAECAVMYSYEYQGTGIYLTILCGPPDQTAANLQAILDTLHTVQRDGITRDELAQAKNKICSQLVLNSELPTNRLFVLGNNWLQRHHYQSVREMIESYHAVTCDDVAQVLAAFPLTECSTVAVGPLRELSIPKAP